MFYYFFYDSNRPHTYALGGLVVSLKKVENVLEVSEWFGIFTNEPTKHMKEYKIIDNEKDYITLWSAERMLKEINRDRSTEWTDYTEEDNLVEAFKHWVEPEERYTCLGEFNPQK